MIPTIRNAKASQADDWSQFDGKVLQGYDALRVEGPVHDKVIRGATFIAEKRAGVMFSKKLWHSGITFEDCTFTCARPDGELFDALWAVRGDGACEDWVFKQCRFIGLRREHGPYLNTAGHITFEECVFSDIAAQAGQFVWNGRTSIPDDAVGETFPGIISMRRCVVENAGQFVGRGRAGFSLSFFGGHQDVRLKNVLVLNDHTDEPSGWEPSGALNCDHRPSIHLDNVRIRYKGMQARPLVRIMDTSEIVVLPNCTIEGGKTQTNGIILNALPPEPVWEGSQAEEMDRIVRARAKTALALLDRE